MRKNLAALICVGLVLVSGACKRSSTINTKDGSVTVEQKGSGETSSMTFTSKDGKSSVNINSGGKVPDDYPKDFPVYPDTKVVLTQSSSEKHTNSLILETTDPSDKIADYYKKGFESNGWTVANTLTSGDTMMFTVTKEKRQGVVQIMSDGGKRNINQVIADIQ